MYTLMKICPNLESDVTCLSVTADGQGQDLNLSPLIQNVFQVLCNKLSYLLFKQYLGAGPSFTCILLRGKWVVCGHGGLS